MRPYISYILLDAARMEVRMEEAKELNPYHLSLYKGRSEEDLAAVAPYLFSVPEDEDDFLNWFMEQGWSDAWGVIVSSQASFEECYRHFRKFLIVQTELGEELYFRFYDPRVLKIFLPICDKHQIIEFFGPVDFFACEGDSRDEALVFQHIDGELTIDAIPANQLFGVTVQ
ncbi:DUF4123 domain-containing protein [Cesiribacter sp. SM1]|uniref:DUF4123 domain-containing protein n=1 Tax=Cesiribacter sp. SM1 TaxID=2861196 RepID=UPI001CD215F0